LVDVYRRFGGMYSLYLKVVKSTKRSNELTDSLLLGARLANSLTLEYGEVFLPKRQGTCSELHGFTSLKIVPPLDNTVRISDSRYIT
jgi:hypothetical protein